MVGSENENICHENTSAPVYFLLRLKDLKLKITSDNMEMKRERERVQLRNDFRYYV